MSTNGYHPEAVSDLRVTVCPRLTDPLTVRHAPLGEVLGRLRAPKQEIRHLVERIRQAEDERKRMKQALPVVLFSGEFAHRAEDGIRAYTGILTVDLDAKDNPEKNLPGLKSLLAQDPYVLAAFVSPSGEGLKLLVRVSSPLPQVEDVEALKRAHAAASRAFFAYLRFAYGLNADVAGKDLARACFVSYDPDLYINPKAEIFRFRQEPAPVPETKWDELALIESALEAIPLGEGFPYHDWLRIGLALAGTLGTEKAVHLMLRHGGGHPGDTPEFLQRSFRGARGDLSLGTVFWYAQQYGWTPPRKEREPLQKAQGKEPPQGDGKAARPVLLIERASAIEPRAIEWLWPGRIARGKYHLIAGVPGLGKSQLTVSLIAAITRGGTWPDRSGQAPLGRALILSAEDDPRDTIVPRLMAAGADLDRVDIIRAVPLEQGRERTFSLLKDLERLRQALTPEHRLLIIDPITAYLGTGEVDPHRTADVRGVLSPLQRLAEDTGLAVVAVSHLNKQGAGSAMNRITGSHAFTAAARIVYLVAPHPEEERLRLFLPVKINIAEMPPGLAFEVQGVKVAGGIQTSRLLWLPGEEVPWTADEVLSMSRGHRQREKLQEAQEWLLEILSQGPRPARDIFRLGEDAGFSRRTLYRAKDALKIESRRTGFQGGFSWMLPNDCQAPSNDCQPLEENLRNSANFPMIANDALKGKVGNHWDDEAPEPRHLDENLTLEYPDESADEPPF